MVVLAKNKTVRHGTKADNILLGSGFGRYKERDVCQSGQYLTKAGVGSLQRKRGMQKQTISY